MPFAEEQQRVIRLFDTNSFVPVFLAHTQNTKTTVFADAKAKVTAMYKGGQRRFEFLARGDESMLISNYVTELLAAIDHLKEEHPDAEFAIGTISSPEIMEMVTQNKNVSFVVTAHWPGEDMIRIAIKNGKPIIATVSNSEEISTDGRVVKPGSKGIDTLDPKKIAALRRMGINAFKIFDFGKIAAKRSELDKPSDSQTALFGLIAIAEAIKESYGTTPVPPDQEFFAMTTGGVNIQVLGYLKNLRGRADFNNLLKEAGADADVIEAILKQTVIAAGGTFITKDYDTAIASGEPSQKVAAHALQQLTAAALATARTGKVPAEKPKATVFVFNEAMVETRDEGNIISGVLTNTTVAALEMVQLGTDVFGDGVVVDVEAVSALGTFGESAQITESISATLAQRGVGTDHVAIYNDKPTATYSPLPASHSSGQRFEYHHRENAAVRDLFERNGLDGITFNKGDVVLIDTIMLSRPKTPEGLEYLYETIKRAKTSGAIIILDINYREALWPGKDSEEKAGNARTAFEKFLPLADLASVSHPDDSKMLWITGEEDAVASSLLDHAEGPKNVLIKSGKDGAKLYQKIRGCSRLLN